jgi:CheY-like chemotaxis protein
MKDKTKKVSIVVVENDEDEQFFIKQQFEASGLFILKAMVKNGDELFEWMETHPDEQPELILSDLNMPGMNGIQILREIRHSSVFSNIPVVITSTSTVKQVMEDCLENGALAYLVKPETFIDYSIFAEQLYQVAGEKLNP